MSDIADNTPILVGCGDVTDMTTPIEQGRSPYDLIAQAARLAIDDAGSAGLSAAIDTVAMIRLFSDTSPRFATKLGASTNAPKTVANKLGLNAQRHIYTWPGGNMPQYLVNMFAESIVAGDTRAVLLCGGEALRTQHGAERAGLPVSWHDDPGGTPETIGDSRRGWSDHEEKHNMRAAIAMYPLFENAIRGQRKRSIPEHMRAIGELMAGFSRVAAANPLATRRDGFTAERLITVDDENRWIGFPYPRFMNSNAFIDQAAAVVMTSVGQARALGIPESKWVYLHGCADAHDHWYVSERIDLHSSPAIRNASRQALAMAGKSLADFRFLDLYSCFASAVEIGCQEIGLAENDPRGLTMTGGLPFFGGPGNNYVTHSIAEMMNVVRARPGSFGMVTANGNYLTKHSAGLYSTEPTKGAWKREDPKKFQAELDALPKRKVETKPTGTGTIETYCVTYGKDAPERGYILGRLDSTGDRFVAMTPDDPALVADMLTREQLGRRVSVFELGGRNVFRPV